MASKDMPLHMLLRLTERSERTATDAELLGQFMDHGDQEAFGELVRRHGPTVLGVCRGILHNVQDAEDAFQAAFLILARKARTIRGQHSLAGWLGRVAFRAALTAKSRRDRQHASEGQVPPMRSAIPPSDPARDETCRLVQEELHRLPAKYHAPLVLCYLEGQTYEEATRQLHWPLGTIKKRLAQGRELLRLRLQRRGVAVSAAGIATLLSDQAARAAVSPTLLRTTVQLAGDVAAGELTRVGSGAVLALVQKMEKSMWLAKLKWAVAALVLVLPLTGGTGWWLSHVHGARQAAAGFTAAPTQQQPAQVADANGEVDKSPAPTKADSAVLPQGAVARLGTLTRRSLSTFSAVAVSPDGKLLASADAFQDVSRELIEPAQIVHIWDVAGDREVARWQANRGMVTVLAFSPDGRILAAGGIDRQVRLWDVVARKELRTLAEGPGGVGGLAFTPDGKVLAASYAHGAVIRLWDVQQGTKIRHHGYVYDKNTGFGWSPLAVSDKYLAARWDGGIQLWELQSGREVQQFTMSPDKQHGKDWPRWPTVLAFSADGKQLAAGVHSHSWGSSACVWSVETARLLCDVRTPDPDLQALMFSPDGGNLVTVGSNFLSRWDVATGKHLQKFPVECEGKVVAGAADGRTVAGGSKSLRLWDAATGKEIQPLRGAAGSITGLEFADRNTLVVASDDGVRLWDVGSSRVRRQFGQIEDWQDKSPSVRIRNDGKLLIWNQRSIASWDVASGQRQSQCGPPGKNQVSMVHGTVSADGRLWAMERHGKGGHVEWLCLYNLAGGSKRFEYEYRIGNGVPRGGPQITALDFAPDGRLLAASYAEGSVCLWSTSTGKLVQQLRPGRDDRDSNTSEEHWWTATSLVFSADGLTLAAVDGSKNVVHLYETATGQRLGSFKLAGKPGKRQSVGYRQVCGLAFSPDGRVLAVDSGDGGIALWDTSTLREIRRLTGHPAMVSALAFAPDGKLLASGSADTSVLVWDTSPEARPPQPDEDLNAQRLAALWGDLGGEASAARRATAVLARHPAQTMPFLKEKLPPTTPAEAERIGRLLADLDSPTFAVRQNAENELLALGARTLSAVRKALEGKPSLDVRSRLERLVERAEKGPPSAEQLRTIRALFVVEQSGTAEARTLLQKLTEGVKDAWLTEQARAALERLERRQRD